MSQGTNAIAALSTLPPDTKDGMLLTARKLLRTNEQVWGQVRDEGSYEIGQLVGAATMGLFMARQNAIAERHKASIAAGVMKDPTRDPILNMLPMEVAVGLAAKVTGLTMQLVSILPSQEGEGEWKKTIGTVGHAIKGAGDACIAAKVFMASYNYASSRYQAPALAGMHMGGETFVAQAA